MEQIAPEKRWVAYFNGFGVVSALGIFDTIEEAQKTRADIITLWVETHKGGYIGVPFNDPTFPWFVTINQDGQQGYDMMKAIESRRAGVLEKPRRRSFFGGLFKGIGAKHAAEEEEKRQAVLYWTNKSKCKSNATT